MMGKPVGGEGKLFYTGFNLEDRVPAEHVLRRVAAAVDFGFARRETAHLYGRNGHESVDLAVLLKLLFLTHFYNARSERELMRDLPVRLDWLWFCGLDLDADIPDHSVLSKARRRWGVELFEKMFTHVLERCTSAGLVGAHTVHADSTLLKASASKEGRVSRVLWRQLERGLGPESAADADKGGDDQPGKGEGVPARDTRPRLNDRLVSPADPDAATHTRRGVGTVLGYRDHRLIDDHAGIILATHATGADGDDGAQLPLLLEQMQERLGELPREAVGDGQYGTLENYALCRRLGIRAYLKKRRGKDSPRVSWLRLLPTGCRVGRALELMGRRRSKAEGSFADAHQRHGHRKCRWRRGWRVQIGCYLIAAVQNIKKLIKARGRIQRPKAGAIRITPSRTLLTRLHAAKAHQLTPS